ncbi:M24 family metallopeptidase [Tundrisphaera lichenicola]|uniref:M24 family metallopeptidase n=1 Tax=Tundrisphaera lichenicola TaxID=2029860 RepID=UPI003EB9C53E
MFDLGSVQAALRESGLDGWLLYDFRGNNPLARRILDLEGRKPGTRRFFYLVPAEGTPTKLVHRIESGALDHLPGEKRVYLAWQELEDSVRGLVDGRKRLAMEYSPRNANPYISRVDAGTIELIRASGVEIVPSGDLIQQFEAVWDDDQWAMHQEAAAICRAAYDVAFGLIAERVRRDGSLKETEVQRAILDHFKAHGATTDGPPIVGVGPHSGDPHYETTPETDAPIREGDFVLVDLWARMDKPRAVYADYTRVGFVGTEVPEKYENLFGIVVRARDAGLSLILEAFADGRPLTGGEVDDATRRVIQQAGFGEWFTHRTGHNIGQDDHGNGAHLDNLETRDGRRLIPRTCFSIEPGIYLPEFGVRTEIDVYIDARGGVHVTGGEPQDRVLPILA